MSEESTKEWKLGDWTTKIKEAGKEIEDIKQINRNLMRKIQELLGELLEAQKRIDDLEDNNRAQLEHIDQLELELKEEEDQITEQIEHLSSSPSPRTSIAHKPMPVTVCPRQAPRKSIVNFLI